MHEAPETHTSGVEPWWGKGNSTLQAKDRVPLADGYATEILCNDPNG